MSNEENQELEEFIQDWHWDEKSHKFAQDYLLDGWRRRAIEHCLHQLKRGIKLEQQFPF
jgi:hypothetical protein